MTSPDPMFRQRLRQYHRDLSEQMEKVERGSQAWFALEKAMFSVAKVHLTLYKEAIRVVHSVGEHGPQ
jgi:hypothetical protein